LILLPIFNFGFGIGFGNGIRNNVCTVVYTINCNNSMMPRWIITDNDRASAIVGGLSPYATYRQIKQFLVTIPGFSLKAGIMVYPNHQNVPVFAITSNTQDVLVDAIPTWCALMSTAGNTNEIANSFTTRSQEVLLSAVIRLLEECHRFAADLE